jgi:protein involved in polysaccharide export with SLBB domain
MQPGERRTFWWTGTSAPWLGLVLCCVAGCSLGRSQVDRALLAEHGLGAGGTVGPYAVHCPDALQVTFADRPDLSFPRTVGADGRIDLGSLGRLRVEGLAPDEIVTRIAEQTGVPAGRVHVDVTGFNSQQVYLFGQVAGLQRAVPYRGQETVLELLQRVGGITAGAAPNDVYVLRPHVADGGTPEVFAVNLRAIVLSHDQQTNLRLQPFDQVYVGETGQSSYVKCVPPCVRPLYEALCGLSHHPSQPPPVH